MKYKKSALSVSRSVFFCVLLCLVRVPGIQAATPADNQDIINQISFLTGSLDTGIVAGLVPLPIVSRPGEVLEFSTNLGLKAIAPALVPPSDETYFPDTNLCYKSFNLPAYDGDVSSTGYWSYSNWFGFWNIDPLPPASQWGDLGMPQVLHSNSDVRLTVEIADDLDSDPSKVLLAEGVHSIHWKATTMLSPFWDITLPVGMMLYDALSETEYGTAPVMKAAKASPKAAAKYRKYLIEAGENVAKAAGLQAVQWGVDQTGFSDAVPTASNYAQQQFTVWDTHTPRISTSKPALTLEARDFGGLRLSLADDQLRASLSYSDDCGKQVSLTNNAASFLPIGTTSITWTAHDSGPYPDYIPSTAAVTQTVTVADTQAPLLVPPAGFARESASDINLNTDTSFSLGSVLVADLADPNPTVTRNTPAGGILKPDHRYAITYMATDDSGNSTLAPASDPEKYTQIVTIKSPGSNTPPTASDKSAATNTSKPVSITLTGIDTDFLDNRYDPLAFKIVDRPAHGEFVAPLLPYFIEDFRPKPVDAPVGTDYQSLACPADRTDGKQLEAKLGALSPSVHNRYMDACYCSPSGGLYKETPPQNFVYAPTYMHITDDDVYYISDRYWSCDVGSSSSVSSPRISKFINGALVAQFQQSNSSTSFDGIFQVDDQKNLWWSVLSEPGTSSNDLQITGLDENLVRLNVPLTTAKYVGSTVVGGIGIDGGSLVNSHVDRTRGVVYVYDKAHIFMFDYNTPDLYYGKVGGDTSYPCGGVNGYSHAGYWMETDSKGNLYQVCDTRVYKFSAPTVQNSSKAPGDLVGWMGKCTANKTDPVTNVKYNYCDEATQTSRGFQCTDETCEQTASRGDGPGQFDQAIHLAIDPNDILYISDYNNSRVQRFTTDGTFAGQAKSTGAGVANDGGFVLGNMGKPNAVSVNSKEFHVLESTTDTGFYFLHIFKTLPFYDITPSSAKVDYVSDFNFQGQDQFSYLVDDGIDNSAAASVSVDVTRAYRPPENLRVECFTDSTFATSSACDPNEDTALYLRLRADDPDGFVGFGGLDTLTFSIKTAPTHGQFTLLTTQVDHVDYRYDPAPDYFGQDGLSFQANDGNASAATAGTLTFNVIPVRDPTVITLPSEIKVARGFSTSFKFDFSDVDKDSFPQPGAVSIDWGDDHVAFANSTPAWTYIGILDQNNAPVNPQINGEPGSGYLIGAHTYDSAFAGITVCMQTQGDSGSDCKTSPTVQVIEATHVSVSRYQNTSSGTTVDVPVEPAANFDFHAYVSNDTPVGWPGLAANNVHMTFTFPQGVTVVNRDSRCASGSPVVCTLGTMNIGDVLPVDFVLQIDPVVAAQQYAFSVLTEEVDDGPRVTDKNVNSLTIQIADDDHDGTINYYDAFPNDPRGATDADHDGMADEWEVAHGLNPANAADAALDPDGDGISNLQEFLNNTNPLLADAARISNGISLATASDDELGYRVAAGDINKDGFSDVVAGAPTYQGQGAIMISYGSAGEVTTSDPITVTGTTGFGSAVAVGDVNNDGYADIAVKSDQGVYLYLAGAGGLSAPILIQGPNTATTRFGTALLIVDIDNDSLPDLIITSPEDTIGTYTVNGAVYVYRASSQYWQQATPQFDMAISIRLANAKLGDSLAVADIDGDKLPDLMVGDVTFAAGQVAGYLGSSFDWTSTQRLDPNFVLSGEAAGDRFGYSLASGADLDGDGIADLIVGAYRNNGYGAAYLYRSSDQFWTMPLPVAPDKIQGANTGDQFGVAVLLTPPTKYTGQPAIIVGANRAANDVDTDAGRVNNYSLSDLNSTWFDAQGAAHDMLGYALANAGDVNGDGVPDVVAGAPDISNGSYVGTGGYIRIYYGGKGPAQTDTDGDFVADSLDNCPNTPNTDQADSNGNGIGDACELDTTSGTGTSGGGGGGSGGGSGGGGGGCAYNAAADEFDPVFPFMLMLSIIYLWRRRYSQITA